MNHNQETSTNQTEVKTETVVIYGVIGLKPKKRFEIDVAELPDELSNEIVYSVLMNAIKHFKVNGNAFIMNVRNQWFWLVKIRKKKEYEVFRL